MVGDNNCALSQASCFFAGMRKALRESSIMDESVAALSQAILLFELYSV